MTVESSRQVIFIVNFQLRPFTLLRKMSHKTSMLILKMIKPQTFDVTSSTTTDLGGVDLVGDLHGERRAGDVLVRELHADVVVALLGGEVLDGAAAVTVVAARHLGLRGPLDGQAQAALAGTARLHGEHLRHVGEAAVEAWAVRLDARRVAARHHVDRERAARHLQAFVRDVDLVRS